ncbi:hypothetical protein ACOMHN_018533 [Nucella lapillus]
MVTVAVHLPLGALLVMGCVGLVWACPSEPDRRPEPKRPPAPPPTYRPRPTPRTRPPPKMKTYAVSKQRGQGVTLSCDSFFVDSASKVTWFKDGGVFDTDVDRLSGGSTDSPDLTFQYLLKGDKGIYICGAQNDKGKKANGSWINVKLTDCSYQRYGPLCEEECGNCAGNVTCNYTNGYCKSCQTGWIPPICQTEEKKRVSLNAQAVALSVGLGAPATLGVIAAILQVVQCLGSGLPSIPSCGGEDSDEQQAMDEQVAAVAAAAAEAGIVMPVLGGEDLAMGQTLTITGEEGVAGQQRSSFCGSDSKMSNSDNDDD